MADRRRVCYVMFTLRCGVCPRCDDQIFPAQRICFSCGLNMESLMLQHHKVRSKIALDMEARNFIQMSYWREEYSNSGIYVLYSHDNLFKIGKSSNIDNRINQHQTSNPQPLELVHIIETNDIDWCELQIHSRIAEYRKSGEWFALTGAALAEIIKISRLDKSNDAEYQQLMIDVTAWIHESSGDTEAA